ncbi:Disease resistance protein [Macleaya cordata]|uniref:Disease resistance protein n=1 Tax=Macleaya cordata TaxID=56857 RepID=A0A200R7W2_MACCD|nr:Disease resistance protein [Macleaya cordata]
MVEAVVTFFLQKLNDLITQETNLLSGVDEQVRHLLNKLEWMRLFLKDADVKHKQDEKLKLWVRQIRDVTYHAEDVIDEFMVKISQHRHENGVGFVGSLTRCITCTHKLPILHELANRIKEINNTMEEISSNRSNYDIKSIEVGESSSSSNGVQLTRKVKRAPIVEELNVVGIEDSIREVKSLLMGGSDQHERQRIVVSIVGMGGLGKTTLAKKVYNSSDIKRHFDCFAWVYVSQEYRLKELLQGIIKCVTVLTHEQKEKMEENELEEKLREYLQQGDKKYLIVLDDIWSTQAWDGLNTAFPDQLNGSRVLLTTRNRDVALRVDPFRNIHELRLLNEVESWELFLKKIFPVQSTCKVSCPSELEELGKKIVAKCGGLPLAIVVLGGLLSRKDKTQSSWCKVQDSISWQLSNEEGPNSCWEILALSYYDLPYYLKSCFLYFGLFPEDHEIRAKKLIHYWVAEGFVQRRGEETMEDIAEDYLEELIQRSLIQVVRRKSDGRIETCRIHDQLHYLSISEAKENRFLEVYGRKSFQFTYPATNVRRLTIHGSLPEKELISRNWYTLHLHSVLCFTQSLKEEQIWSSFFVGFKLLRVLELEGIDCISTLPKEIGQLIHLKYLGLRRTGLNRIPHSIGRLVNLQSLDLRTTSLKSIPIVIWSLTQLRHLYVHGFPCLLIRDKYLNRHTLGVDNLTNLQTLRMTSGNWIEGGGLGKLKVLKKLVIIGSLIPYKKEMSDSIAKLDGLRSLELWDCEEVPKLLHFLNHKFLYKLLLDGRLEKLPSRTEFFPPNLNKLTLWKSQLELDPMEILEKLPNLRILNLLGDSYVGKKIVCSEEGFVRLQVLEIWGLEGLEELIVKEGALICLRRLVIGGCEHLKMLPDGLKKLSTVQELQLSIMSDEFMNRVEENVGGDWEKIKHIPSVIRGSSF